MLNEKIKYWIDSAASDLDAAKILLDNNKILQSLFHCNITVEKSFKAYYSFIKNEEPPHLHNLIMLSEKCELVKIMPDSYKKTLDILMPLNIKERTQDEEKKLLKIYTRDKNTEIYNQTEALHKWIISLINK